jgi:hypothetical protein
MLADPITFNAQTQLEVGGLLVRSSEVRNGSIALFLARDDHFRSSPKSRHSLARQHRSLRAIRVALAPQQFRQLGHLLEGCSSTHGARSWWRLTKQGRGRLSGGYEGKPSHNSSVLIGGPPSPPCPTAMAIETSLDRPSSDVTMTSTASGPT